MRYWDWQDKALMLVNVVLAFLNFVSALGGFWFSWLGLAANVYVMNAVMRRYA